MAPPVNGNPYQTIWFYERSRGKWEQDQMKLTPAQRQQFIAKHPKNQVLKKEKLAKCLNAFAMNPHEVCQSSAINFKRFAGTIDDIYEKSRDSINEEYFKKCVCCVIVFDTLDRMVNKAEWYPSGGNKAQIVPYSIAKLMSMLPKNTDLDWVSIWKNQTLYHQLATELEQIAHAIHEFLMKEADGGLVRSMSRKLDTWKKCKDLKLQLSDQFIASLVSLQETRDAEMVAKRAHKFNSSVDLSVEIFKLGATYWHKVYAEVAKEAILPYGELSFINGIGDYINLGKLPSPKQCKQLMKIIDKIENKGFVMPES